MRNRVVLAAALVLVGSTQFALAGPAYKMCASGSMTMGSFKDHLAELRKSNRYPAEDIDDLEKKERQGGPEFFSTQVVIKDEQSGSGDFDLKLFQGFSDPQAEFRSVKAWACSARDYPVAYFVGFKVREIRNGAIYVSREKGAVNVISLKDIDPDLKKHTQVRILQSDALLCQDIGVACIDTIFYGRY